MAGATLTRKDLMDAATEFYRDHGMEEKANAVQAEGVQEHIGLLAVAYDAVGSAQFATGADRDFERDMGDLKDEIAEHIQNHD